MLVKKVIERGSVRFDVCVLAAIMSCVGRMAAGAPAVRLLSQRHPRLAAIRLRVRHRHRHRRPSKRSLSPSRGPLCPPRFLRRCRSSDRHTAASGIGVCRASRRRQRMWRLLRRQRRHDLTSHEVLYLLASAHQCVQTYRDSEHVDEQPESESLQ